MTDTDNKIPKRGALTEPSEAGDWDIVLGREVDAWVRDTFGDECMEDRSERVLRFLEEVLELAVAEGVSIDEVRGLVDRVADQDQPGEVEEELGGIMVTLLAYAEATGSDLKALARRELDRIKARGRREARRRHALKVDAGLGLYIVRARVQQRTDRG